MDGCGRQSLYDPLMRNKGPAGLVHSTNGVVSPLDTRMKCERERVQQSSQARLTMN